VARLSQEAMRTRPTSATESMSVKPTVRSQRLRIFAIGIVQAAVMMLVMILMTVSSECPSKLLVMYGDKFAVRLDCRAWTKYVSHMLSVDVSLRPALSV
jgi:hypothetical protein